MENVKIQFQLMQDEDGYPPIAVEGVWAKKTPLGYLLDNIPFFATEATVGDTVSAYDVDDVLWFSGVVHRSDNSLMRVVLFDLSRLEELRKEITKLGCDSEFFKLFNLVAVNVPMTASISVVREYLCQMSVLGWLDYEEVILRQ